MRGMRAITRNIHTSIDWFLFAHPPDMVLYANFCNNKNQTTAGPGMGIGVWGIYEYTTTHGSNTSAATTNATNFDFSNAGEVNNNCKLCILLSLCWILSCVFKVADLVIINLVNFCRHVQEYSDPCNTCYSYDCNDHDLKYSVLQ